MLKTMFWKYQRPNTIPSWRLFAFLFFAAASSDSGSGSGLASVEEAAAETDLGRLVSGERKVFSRIWRLGICGNPNWYLQLMGLSAAAAWRGEIRVGF